MAKFGIKKIVLALAGLGLTGAAFASLTPDSAFSNPTPTGYGWHISAMGNWLQPSTNDLTFASVNTINTNTSGTTTNNAFGAYGEGVEPNYDFGYGFELGMQIPGTTDDVTVNWQQLNTENTDRVGPVGPFQTVVLPDFSNVNAAEGKATLDYDAVNLEFGHTLYEGPWTVRPFAGVQYARLTGNLDTTGVGQSTNASDDTTKTVAFVDEDGDFHGIGPRAGVDAKYNLGYGFGIVGEAAGELLVGTANSSLNSSSVSTVTDDDGDVDSTKNTVYSVNPEEEHTVVPGLEAKAGLAYDQVINPSLCFGIEAGYYVADYIHAIPRSNAPADVSFSTSSPAIDANGNHNVPVNTNVSSNFFAINRNQDFSMQGPYVAVTLNF